MKARIVSEKNNPLLDRRDLVIEIEHDGPTPSESVVIELVASQAKTKATHVVVNKIEQLPGRRSARVYAKVYNKPVREEEKKQEGEEKEEGQTGETPEEESQEAATKEEEKQEESQGEE